MSAGLLRTFGVDRLVVCGMMTQMCVDATTRAAFGSAYARIANVSELIAGMR